MSSGMAGLALTAFGLVYAVTQFPSGSYSDAYSRASVILPAFAVLIASFMLLGVAVSAALFVAAVVLLGLGKGLYASPSRALLGDLYSENRGQVLGFYSAGTDVGGLFAAGVAALVLSMTVWRAAFVPVVVLMVVVMVLYVVWNREPYEAGASSLAMGATTRRLVSSRQQREILVAYSLFYFAVGGLTNFYPLLLVEGGGFSETVASMGFALIFLVGLFVKPTAGRISDLLPRRTVSVAGMLVAALGFAVITAASTLAVVAVGTVIAAVGYKTQFPIADALVIENAPKGGVGGGVGVARMVFLTANALGPGVVGVVADLAGFRTAFWVLVAGLLVSTGVLVRQRFRK